MVEINDDGTSLEPLFLIACSFISNRCFPISDSDSLILYSYPPLYDVVKRNRFEAWQSLGDLSREDSMKRYIALVIKLGDIYLSKNDAEWKKDFNEMKSVWEREYSDKALFILPGYESEEDEDDEQNYYLRTSNRKY
ncbi:hypothetical protein ROZALSC1DRAFT_25316 [Rozella allomycis CSF55]|uniref:ACB domain-containing protein n=1 Tax=Rozella allomycis (strain CSF55) TaxID=988480 RepID=A0A4P9YB30_ROZAC|nr:hypothetical protein ROZALSC1DRAFT_25316 [Rozella allomycis CSF55]